MHQERGSRGAPPLPVTVDLDGWLDGAQDWRIPVPARFDVSGEGILTGSGTAETEFAPSEKPWLPTEFAHVAAGLGSEDEAESPPFSVVREAVAFADRFGVTGPWADSKPPREVDLATFLRQAWGVRQALLAYRGYAALRANGPRPRRAKKSAVREILRDAKQHMAVLDAAWGPVDAFLQAAPGLGDFSWDWYREAEGAHSPEWPEGAHAPEWPWPGQPRGLVRLPGLDLFDLIRLELAADFSAAREVRECKLEDCGRLFVWALGKPRGKGKSLKLRRSTNIPGRSPNYCHYLHARQAREDQEGG